VLQLEGKALNLIIISIFSALVIIPTISLGGFLINTVEVALIAGVMLASRHCRSRFFKSITRDYFALGLLLFTGMAVVLMAENMSDLRDFNHIRFHSALPVIAYSFFYSIAYSKAVRSSVLNVMMLALLVGLLLNFLVLIRPDLPIWSLFSSVKDDAIGERFGANSEGRVSGLFLGDSIFTAVFCSICILNGLSLFSLSRIKSKRLIASALIVLGSIFLVYTQTRMACIIVSFLFVYGVSYGFPMFRRFGMWGNRIFIVCLSPLLLKIIIDVFYARGTAGDEATRIVAWRNSLGLILGSDRDFCIGSGIHRLFDTVGIWHSHNVWLFTGVVYGVPMAIFFIILYITKIFELWRWFTRRRLFITKDIVTPNDDEIIMYSTLLVFMFFMFESIFETTFFYIPRVSVFLYALLGMSKAASEAEMMGPGAPSSNYGRL